MALRDQPYLPLYVKDFQNDEQLAYCSAASTGIYIRLMCIMHRSNPYGKFFLKTAFKDERCFAEPFAQANGEANGQPNIQAPPEHFAKVFACMLAKQLAKLMPYDTSTIVDGLVDLIENNVLYIDGDYLCQKRMIKDGNLSDLRSVVGKKGVQKKKEKNEKNNFASTFAEPNGQANIKANGSASGLPKHQANTANENQKKYTTTIKDNEGIGNKYKEENIHLINNNTASTENFASTFAEPNGQANIKANGSAMVEAKDLEFYSGDFGGEIPIEICLELVLTQQKFFRTKEILIRAVMEREGDMANELSMADCEVKIRQWGDIFNQELIKSTTFKKKIDGKEGWAAYFINSTKLKLKTTNNPLKYNELRDIELTKLNSKQTPSKPQHVTMTEVAKMTQEEQEAYYDPKNSKALKNRYNTPE